VGERNPTGGPLEHLGAEGFFQVGDSATDRGLGNSQGAGGGGKAVQVHYFGQYGQLGRRPEKTQERFNPQFPRCYCFTPDAWRPSFRDVRCAHAIPFAGVFMKISVPALSVDIFTHTLGNLSAILEKGTALAAQKKFDSAILVSSRLAPDMLPLSKQVQIACDTAKKGAARLAGVEAPPFEDNEKTIEELRVRIARTIDFLKTLPPGAFEGCEDRDIKVPAGDRTLEFKGLSYLQRWILPNLFFHVTTAYNILRHNGVEIGKRDYLGSL
jgi:hypothetical protein